MESVKICCVNPAFGLCIDEEGGHWECLPGKSVDIPRDVYESMKRRNSLGGIKVVGQVVPLPTEPEKPAGKPKGGKKAGPSPFAEDTDPDSAPEPEPVPETPAEPEPEPVPVEEQ